MKSLFYKVLAVLVMAVAPAFEALAQEMTGADLAAMIGSTVYEVNAFGAAQKVYAKADGNVYQQWGSNEETVIVEASAQITLENSVYSCPAGFDFYVNDGNITKIMLFGFVELVPALGEYTEADLAALMGDDVYVGLGDETIIAHDGAIYMVDGDGTETALHDMFTKFEKIGDGLQFSLDEEVPHTYIKFSPFGDKYLIIYTKDHSTPQYVQFVYVVPVDEADLVALMGDAVYAAVGHPSMMLFVKDGKVFSGTLGSDAIMYGAPLSENNILTKNGDTFIFVNDSFSEYEFFVQDGKVSEVEHEGYRYVYAGSGNATSVEKINAEKSSKVVKTIEDGRVVIIRDNKKYDLSGREL